MYLLDVDDVLRALERAARAAPTDAEAHFRLGAALARAGRADEAGRALRDALVASPGHALAAAELARLPGLARGPWPTEDGEGDGARRASFPGARKGALAVKVVLPSPPRGAPVVTARNTALVATFEGAFEVRSDGSVERAGPRGPQRGPPVLAGSDALVLLEGERGVALAGARGEVVWSHGDLGGRAFEPLVVDDMVVLGVENVGLVALDLASGGVRFTVAIDAEAFSRPSCGRDIYVAVRGDRPSVVRGYGEAWRWQLHAIDRTGRVPWSSPARSERDTGPPEVPLVAGDRVLARVEQDLVALDTATGKALWDAKVLGPAALGTDGLVRAVRDGRLVGLDAKGEVAWQGDSSQHYPGGRLATDALGTTFVAQNDRVVAIGKSGAYLWSCATARTTSRPVVGNGCVLVTSFHEKTLSWIV